VKIVATTAKAALSTKASSSATLRGICLTSHSNSKFGLVFFYQRVCSWISCFL